MFASVPSTKLRPALSSLNTGIGRIVVTIGLRMFSRMLSIVVLTIPSNGAKLMPTALTTVGEDTTSGMMSFLMHAARLSQNPPSTPSPPAPSLSHATLLKWCSVNMSGASLLRSRIESLPKILFIKSSINLLTV